MDTTIFLILTFVAVFCGASASLGYCFFEASGGRELNPYALGITVYLNTSLILLLWDIGVIGG